MSDITNVTKLNLLPKKNQNSKVKNQDYILKYKI